MGYSEGTVGYRGGTVRVQCTPLSSPQRRRENAWIGGGCSILCFQSVLVVFHDADC